MGHSALAASCRRGHRGRGGIRTQHPRARAWGRAGYAAGPTQPRRSAHADRTQSVALMPTTPPTPVLTGPATPSPAAVTAPASQPAPLAAPSSPSPPQVPPPDRHSPIDQRNLEQNNLEQSAAGGRGDTPAPVAACPDQVIAVQTQTGTPSYPVGQHPLFRLLITNIGPAACTRDLDPRLRELIVTTTATNGRVWSDRDCTTVHYPDLRTLQPGMPAVFELRWSGLTSNPHCAGTHTPALAGAYQLMGRFGDRSGGPIPFALTR